MIQLFSKRAARRARRNPDDGIGLPREAGMTLLATAIGVAAAVGLEKVVNDMKKGGTGADKDAAKYTDNQVSAITGGVGLVVGVGLHVKGVAPRVGKALIAGSTALAASRFVAHRKDTDAQKAARLPGSRGIAVNPVATSQGAYGYLPSGAAVGAQYGQVGNDGAVVRDPNVPPGQTVSAQYGTVQR